MRMSILTFMMLYTHTQTAPSEDILKLNLRKRTTSTDTNKWAKEIRS